MCRIRQDVGILRIILVNRNSLEPYIFVGCHRMSENSDFGLHKFYCIIKTEVLDHIRHRYPWPIFSSCLGPVVLLQIQLHLPSLSSVVMSLAEANYLGQTRFKMEKPCK